MKVSKQEILHMANLAHLTLNDEEVEKYLSHLENILDFANIVNNAPVENLEVTIGGAEAKNRFRKDEVEKFEDIDGLLQNAITKEQNMFKLPKVIN